MGLVRRGGATGAAEGEDEQPHREDAAGHRGGLHAAGAVHQRDAPRESRQQRGGQEEPQGC